MKAKIDTKVVIYLLNSFTTMRMSLGLSTNTVKNFKDNVTMLINSRQVGKDEADMAYKVLGILKSNSLKNTAQADANRYEEHVRLLNSINSSDEAKKLLKLHLKSGIISNKIYGLLVNTFYFKDLETSTKQTPKVEIDTSSSMLGQRHKTGGIKVGNSTAYPSTAYPSERYKFIGSEQSGNKVYNSCDSFYTHRNC